MVTAGWHQAAAYDSRLNMPRVIPIGRLSDVFLEARPLRPGPALRFIRLPPAKHYQSSNCDGKNSEKIVPQRIHGPAKGWRSHIRPLNTPLVSIHLLYE
jgi:hypothetical protein